MLRAEPARNRNASPKFPGTRRRINQPHRAGQLQDLFFGDRRVGIALAHHHPAHIVEHDGPVLVEAAQAYAELRRSALLEFSLGPMTSRNGRQRIARIDRRERQAA